MSGGGRPAEGGADTAPRPQALPFHGHLSTPPRPALDVCGTPGYPSSARRDAEAESEAFRTVIGLESRAEEQALIAELRSREQDSRVRISELEGTLSQVAVLQKQAMAERMLKEQDYLREISRLERKAAEAQSPGQADADAQARLAEAERREQEHIQQNRKLTEKVEELERAPAIMQTLLAEVAKKDHERLSEIGTLKDALCKARSPSSVSSPVTASMQSLLSGAGRIAEFEAEVAGFRRELSASAALEGELELLKSQLKARDKEMQDLEERHSQCRAELEKHQKQGTPRLHGGRKLGCGGAQVQAGASGNQVFAEWRDHLDRFSASGNEAQFCHMQHLEVELARQLLLDPDLFGAVRASRCEKAERLQAAPDRSAGLSVASAPPGSRARLAVDVPASARGVQPVRAVGYSHAFPATDAQPVAAAVPPLEFAGMAQRPLSPRPLSPRPVSPRPAQWSPLPASPRPLGGVSARGPSTAREGVALRMNTYVAAGLGAHPGYAADARAASPVRRFVSAGAWPVSAGPEPAGTPRHAPSASPRVALAEGGALAPLGLMGGAPLGGEGAPARTLAPWRPGGGEVPGRQGGSCSVQVPTLQGRQASTLSACRSPAHGLSGLSEARLAHSVSVPVMFR